MNWRDPKTMNLDEVLEEIKWLMGQLIERASGAEEPATPG
jgi:hypothetical protein